MTEERFRELVHVALGPEAAEAPLNTDFHGMGFDSLDAIEFVLDLEDETGKSITDEQATAAKTLGDFFSIVKGTEE